jgi:hypothetical protein
MGDRRDCEVGSLTCCLLFDYPCGRSLREDAGQGHWYPSVFKNAQVQAFLDSILGEERQAPRRSSTFTLTTAIPAETGSLHGWRTLKLLVPGRSVLITSVYTYDEFLPSSFNPTRLARLTVEMGESIASVTTCNVACFSVDVNQLEVRRLDIDGCTLAIPDISAGVSRLSFERDSGGWRVSFLFPISRQRVVAS